MNNTIERIKKRIEKERAYDEIAWETLADKGNRVHQVLHSSRNRVYNIILEVIDEELAKEPPEEPNIPIQCVDGSCPIALSEEYEEWGMDVVHSCAECQYQPQVQPINTDSIIKQIEEQTSFLKDCTKYGNKDSEQQHKSYSTMMMYEVADLVDDLIEIVRRNGEKEVLYENRFATV